MLKMTDQIQKSISLLRTKFMGIHQNLSSAKKEIDTLNMEIKQVDNGSVLSQGRSNEQIDELVKEIEICIAALKK